MDCEDVIRGIKWVTRLQTESRVKEDGDSGHWVVSWVQEERLDAVSVNERRTAPTARAPRTM